ncbi:hypothetical protein K1719_020262 [Acacia pycnantha]|nr:hypothetical protein K1719_020262 [Acacia pycnantha]
MPLENCSEIFNETSEILVCCRYAVREDVSLFSVKTTVFRKTCQNTVNEAIASGSEESRTKERGKQQGHGSG